MSSKHSKKKRHYKDPLRHYHPATSVILSGYRSGLSQYAIKPPLFRASTFEFESAEDGELFFKRAYHLEGDDGKEPGLVYSRLNNPNLEIIEDKLIAAEGGAGQALLFPSGMSAISTSLLALLPPNAKILYSDPVYGGTYLFFTVFCPNRFAIEAVPVDTSSLQKVETYLKEKGPVDMVYLESPTNPTMTLTDIKGVRKLMDQYCKPEAILAIDNTFLGPVFQRPFELGADLVLYSATKFLGGHSDLVSGVALTKKKEHHRAIQDFRTIMGATSSPDNAWLLTRSIETLWVRMERQAEKALKVAQRIVKHPKIKKVVYPGLLTEKDGEQYRIFKSQCHGNGSMMTFYLKDNTRQAAFEFLNNLNVCHLAVSLGGTESLIQHPRSMTHSDMSVEDLERAGIEEGMIRLSVGLESSEDITADLEAALGS